MTNQELIDYYAKLLILQYRGKPKAFATIQALAKPVIMDQLPLAVQGAFNIDDAIGTQLDVLGKYVGVTRTGHAPNGDVITLTDADFRSFIRVSVLKNSSGSDLATIQNLLNLFFAGEIFVFDYQDMTMDYLINASVGSQDLVKLFVTEGSLPKPMGVRLRGTIYFPVIDKFFGFRTYDLPGHNVSPFNSYSSYDMNAPWLSYSMAI